MPVDKKPIAIDELNATDIDFAQIRNNLKDYLKGDPNFTDYDFDGSALSSLIDILSYVTHINAINANIGINEAFLNSAQFRGSVVGHAQRLSYTPKSATAPSAFLRVTLNTFDPNVRYTLPRGYRFRTNINGKTYNFVTLTDYVANREGVFEEVRIVEGTFQHSEFVYDSRGTQNFIILDENIDTTSLRVEVMPSAASMDNKEVFVEARMLTDITPNSKVYFLSENPDARYQFSFGDGVIGKELKNGNIIRAEYVVTNKAEANGARIFSIIDKIGGTSDVSVQVLSSARGGGERESIDSVRRNAPITFAAQNRAVTPLDFESVIRNQFANVEDVKVWGGEDNDPPVYGKVFVSVLPRTATVLSANERRILRDDILRPKRVTTIGVEIVDPEFLFIRLEVFFKYDPTLTNLAQGELIQRIKDRVKRFDDEDVRGFGGVFRYSRFANAIDHVDRSILSSVTRVYLQKRFIPVINVPTRYELNFSADLLADRERPVIERSSEFTYLGLDRCRFVDRIKTDGSNRRVIDIVRGFGTAKQVVVREAGHVERQRIVLTAFGPSAYQGNSIMIEVVPNSNDIAASFNNVITIDHESPDFRVHGEVDSIQAGRDFSGSAYNTVSRIR